ncbi:mtDNA inheritance, partitioning of the mitochondrial organelle [Ascosphaera pollenicola]|nr:mtDNA inheritance, partitioning of the mitochondrial organelle [Ascosphaera pollenicola]
MQALASPEETELSNDPVREQQDEFLAMDSYEQDELLSKGFDMNLSPITSNKKDSHVFGQTRIYRDLPASGTPPKSNISLGSSNTTRLLNSGTLFQRYETIVICFLPPPRQFRSNSPFANIQIVSRFSFDTSLLFPVLDSAPKDLFSFSNGSSHAKHLRLRAGLSSTTRTREYLGSLQALASRAMRVDEREMLVNGLGDLSDNYKHRWDSNDESDDL